MGGKRKLSGRESKEPQLVQLTKYDSYEIIGSQPDVLLISKVVREPTSDLEFLIKNKIKEKYNYYMVRLFENNSPYRTKKLTLLSIHLR